MKDISIKPIFVQTPKIWAEFANVENASVDSINLQYCISNRLDNTPNLIRDHRYDWQRAGRYNIAFGAYDFRKMIGFAKAFLLDDNEMYLDSLYVDYDFQGRGIGKQLMQNIEDASLVASDKIGLFSLNAAHGFYESLNYSAVDGNTMEKDLVQSTRKVVPIFQLDKKHNFNFNFDIDYGEIVPFRNCPKYAFITPDGKINAIGINTDGNRIQYWFDSNANVRTINNYKRAIASAFRGQR